MMDAIVNAKLRKDGIVSLWTKIGFLIAKIQGLQANVEMDIFKYKMENNVMMAILKTMMDAQLHAKLKKVFPVFKGIFIQKVNARGCSSSRKSRLLQN